VAACASGGVIYDPSPALRQTERNYLRIFKKRKEIIRESFRRILKKLDAHKKNRQGELSQNFESTLDTGDESREICFFFSEKVVALTF
jgi:hypothetical protein